MRGLRSIRNQFSHLRGNSVLAVGAFLFGLTVFGGFGLFSQPDNAFASDPNNDIVRGGIWNRDLAAKCTGDVKTIMDHYRIDCNLSGVVDGRACKDNKVYVGDKVVATNAQSIGRMQKPGDHSISIGGQTYWEAPNSVAFQQECIDAFVKLDQNGGFVYAILKPCGNPIWTPNPVVPPKPPTPEKPAYKCESLTAIKVDRTRYKFTATASASGGAKVVGYNFVFGDGTNEDSTGNVIEHTYAQPGNYVAHVAAKVEVDGKIVDATGPNCNQKITIAAPEKIVVCEIATGKTVQVDKDYDRSIYSENFADCEMKVCDIKTKTIVTIRKGEFDTTRYSKSEKDCEHAPAPVPMLPQTGAGDLIGAGLGIGSVIIAASYYIASRRDLLGALLSR